MSISTLVLIVLAIIVLVIVVVGFTGGWSNLSDRISNLGGGKANVGLVVQACKIACDTNSQYDYCSQQRKVVFDDKTSTSASCHDLEQSKIDGRCIKGGSVTADSESFCKDNGGVWYVEHTGIVIPSTCGSISC